MVRTPLGALPIFLLGSLLFLSSAYGGVVYEGGPVVSQGTVYLVFLGAEWENPDLQAQSQNLTARLNRMLSLGYLSGIAQYETSGTIGISVGGAFYLSDAYLPSASVVGKSAGAPLDPGLDAAVAAGLVPAPSGPAYSTMYALILPPSKSLAPIDVSLAKPSGIRVNGYHLSMLLPSTGGPQNALVISYFPNPPPQGKPSMLKVLLHELSEAVTDPFPASGHRGWFDVSKNAEGEIADLCEGQPAQFAGESVPSYWSNTANACWVPAQVSLSPRCNVGNTYQRGAEVGPNSPVSANQAHQLIQSLSQAILFRPMDPSGLGTFEHWVALGGYYGLIESAAAMATGSAEWAAEDCVSLTDQQIINQLFKILLQRPPYASEFQRYSALLDQGGIATVLRQLLHSAAIGLELD